MGFARPLYLDKFIVFKKVMFGDYYIEHTTTASKSIYFGKKSDNSSLKYT